MTDTAAREWPQLPDPVAPPVAPPGVRARPGALVQTFPARPTRQHRRSPQRDRTVTNSRLPDDDEPCGERSTFEEFVLQVLRVAISNFRGIQNGVVDLHRHSLLVGGNNIGKSTVCEAIDVALGPERQFRRPVIDEHDFYRSDYLPAGDESVHLRSRLK